MCGIVGFLPGYQEASIDLENMLTRIAHRGPDDEGMYIDDFIALGHRRLSIIDISGGKQPMNYQNYMIVFNGEIYNYKELKEQLIRLGHCFQTESDTEVLLHAYQEYGYDMLNFLRGMFAFVIYDKDKKEVFMARDHFGMKPLYYYYDSKHLLFGSEIKAFLDHPYFIKEFNEDVLDIYLKLNFVSGDKTFFKNVKQLLPGHYMIYKNHEIIIKQYYTLDFKKSSVKEDIESVKNILEDSISHHMISDVEIGSFLSGGIDSSYLVSVARPNKTYTLGYSDQRYSEIELARDLTHQLDIENYSRIVSKDEYFKVLPDVFYHMDEPLADPSAIALYFISELASHDVKVVLSGEGADEIFGGYNTYRSEIDQGLYGKIPYGFKKGIARLVKHAPEFRGKDFLIRNGSTVEESYLGVNPVFHHKECLSLLKNKETVHQHDDIIKQLPDITQASSSIQKKQSVDLRMWFVKDILQKADKMTMAHSLESRMPFTDKYVFEVASYLDDTQKVTTENTKVLLRQVSKRSIPNHAYDRKKRGFPVPLREWIREDDVYHTIYDSFQTPFMTQYFHNEKIIKLLDDHKNKKKDCYKKIWTLYTLSLWHQIFFEEEYKKR